MMVRLITLLFLLLVLGFQTQAQEINYNRTINIVTEKDTTTSFKSHDLVVIQGNGRYRIEYYIKQGNKVICRSANVKSEISFDKASYKSISDNVVAIRLLDSNSINEYKFKVIWNNSAYAIAIQNSRNN